MQFSCGRDKYQRKDKSINVTGSVDIDNGQLSLEH